MKRLRESFFRAVCLLFSGLLLVLLLMTDIDTAKEKDRQRRLSREVQSLTEENEVLRARAEAQLSLSEIERRAREELGMQPCSAGQLERLTIG